MNLTRFWWALGVVIIIAALIICLVPGHEIPGSLEVNDKLSHVIGHALIGAYFTGLVPRRRWWKIFVFLLCFGGAIELAQYSMHVGREGDPRDIVANSVGALLGLALGWLGMARWPEWAAWLLGRRTA